MDENKIKTIVVCGDSFCSAQPNERLHFSQLLEDKYNYHVINLAQGGMSNVGICFQIRQAVLAIKPDIVVYNITSPDRIELVMKDEFKIDNGLHNFVYAFKNNSSYGTQHVGTADSPIFSTVWAGLSQHGTIPVSKDQQDAIRQYLIHLFDWNLKSETDSWMFEHWHRKMLELNIIPLRLRRGDQVSAPMYEFADKNPNYNVTYHTDAATQEQMAENIHRELLACL